MWRVIAWLVVSGAGFAQQTTFLKTSTGAEFALKGGKKGTPAPVLLVLAGSIAQTFAPNYDALSERLVSQNGFVAVTLDIPCHGADQPPGEPPSLKGWRARIERGENTIAAFTAKVSSILDYLIAEGYADPQRIYAAGTSRGGFLAFHVAAAEPRIRAVVAFAPVTELTELQEFKGMENDKLTRSLSTMHLASRLAGRPIWMCIGNNDNRVGTDRAIRFSRRVVEAAVATGVHPDIEVVISPSKGHTIAADSHDRAAAWLLARP